MVTRWEAPLRYAGTHEGRAKSCRLKEGTAGTAIGCIAGVFRLYSCWR